MNRLMVMVCTLLLASCASMINGRNETISVDSQPPGADSTIRCDHGVSAHGVTPATIVIPRTADGCRITITREGMQPATVTLERGFSRHYWSNMILAGGLPVSVVAAFAGAGDAAFISTFAAGIGGAAGLIIDRLNGAMYDHNPRRVTVTLEPVH